MGNSFKLTEKLQKQYKGFLYPLSSESLVFIIYLHLLLLSNPPPPPPSVSLSISLPPSLSFSPFCGPFETRLHILLHNHTRFSKLDIESRLSSDHLPISAICLNSILYSIFFSGAGSNLRSHTTFSCFVDLGQFFSPRHFDFDIFEE